MAVTTLTKVGAFSNDVATQINDNFTYLGSTTAGGALTSGHLLIGSAGGVATDKAITGDATLIASGALTVATVNGVKFASGIIALDNTNPTPVVTGLTTITSFVATLNRATAVSSGTAFVTYGTISGGSVDLYGWVLAGSASTGTENVAWFATGT
jgi:hypothetical protein